MDIRFKTWNIRSLYRAGSLKTVTSELGKYNIDLVAVQEGRWDKHGIQKTDYYTFLYGNGNVKHHLATGFLMHQEIRSAVKRVEFISDKTKLRGHWCNMVLNLHESTEDKGDDMNNSFCEKLGKVFHQFLQYHMILLGYFNVKVGRKDIFKPTIRNESLHEISNDNGVRVVKLGHIKNYYKGTMCPYCNIRNYTS